MYPDSGNNLSPLPPSPSPPSQDPPSLSPPEQALPSCFNPAPDITPLLDAMRNQCTSMQFLMNSTNQIISLPNPTQSDNQLLDMMMVMQLDCSETMKKTHEDTLKFLKDEQEKSAERMKFFESRRNARKFRTSDSPGSSAPESSTLPTASTQMNDDDTDSIPSVADVRQKNKRSGFEAQENEFSKKSETTTE